MKKILALIEMFCKILDCEVEDIMKYTKDDEN